jgi:hypothetical protein
MAISVHSPEASKYCQDTMAVDGCCGEVNVGQRLAGFTKDLTFWQRQLFKVDLPMGPNIRR